MASSSGLSVKKPVSDWNSLLQANFKDLFKALAKGGLDVTTQNWVAVGKDLVDAATAVGFRSDDPGELAWTLIYAAMIRAIVALVGESQYLMTTGSADMAALVEQLDFSFERRELEITAGFFEHPERLVLLEDMKLPLRQWFEGVGMSAAQAEALSNRLPTYFVFELEKEWRDHRVEYAQILAQVTTPMTAATARLKGWGLYEAWLQKQIKEPMMFEAFGLDDVYVPLRAYFRRKVEGKDGAEAGLRGSERERDRYERVVVDLETALKAWIQTAKKDDAIRVISGGPGSGKSSFAKIFAAHHAAAGAFPVLFVPLHQFDPKGDLIKSVGEFVRYDEYIKENPVDFDNGESRLLLIFDGLDELAMQGNLSKEVAQNFVYEVQAKVRQFNRREMRLQVVFTGREVAVQESFKDPCQILHVLSYFIPENKREKENNESYIDERNFLTADQRGEWWQKYSVATQKTYTGIPAGLERKNLTEITAQPLLNYLVALSYVQGNLTLSETTNLNTVYADLLDAVYERGYEDNRRHTAIGELKKEEFVRILEEIALAAWHGDGRTTTVEEIDAHCESAGLKRLLEIFEEGAQAGVTRLLAAFYFRQSGERSDGKTFEFTHKSFGEYLTARRTVRAMGRIQKQLDRRQEDMEEGWDEREALKHWAEVCGPTRMDAYLLSFLRDEVALQDTNQVAKWQRTFSLLISVMLKQGMPMEKIEPPLRYSKANRWAVHSEESLLAALNVCALKTREISRVKWPNSEAFGSWLKRLHGQRTNSKNNVALRSLSFLDLSSLFLDFQDFYGANLHRTSFANSSLAYANLMSAHIQETTFTNSALDGARFNSAAIYDTDFSDLRLNLTRFDTAFLDKVVFDCAQLNAVSFDQADMNDVSFVQSQINRVSFEKAGINAANFNGSELSRVSFDDSYLRETTFDKVKLNSVRAFDTSVDKQSLLSLCPKGVCSEDVLDDSYDEAMLFSENITEQELKAQPNSNRFLVSSD